MSPKLKLYLGRKILDSLYGKAQISSTELKSLIHLDTKPSQENIEMIVSLTTLENQFGVSNVKEILRIEPDDIIKNVKCVQENGKKNMKFALNKGMFIKDVLETGPKPDTALNSKNIVVEFSSPNVAKPFHVGHLRSTIIGNFISNLYTYLNDKVTRINYLGDWGTQFGFIKVGIDELKYTPQQIKSNPMKLLYESYVHANKLGETDPQILERAKKVFFDLENGKQECIADWQSYIDYTREELESMYKRLGVTFDVYQRESMYNINFVQDVMKTLKEKDICKMQDDGKVVAEVDKRKISLIKSDGTSLYLTRDIAAAVDRFCKYKFDKMYYVVENGQNDHFNALKSILHQMQFPWANRIVHIKFGRIHGMSTRKGKVVFLKDILDECRELMLLKQVTSPTTKVPITESDVSDILGVSCVLINDLKQRRQKDYNFSWDKVLQVEGDTGVRLQYTHCRLCSLEENCGVKPAKECLPEMLNETEAVTLITEIARFHDVLDQTEKQLESCVLVSYLFHLCNHINRALKTQQIKGVDKDLASQRLLMFNTARETLRRGMTILGLKPLSKM